LHKYDIGRLWAISAGSAIENPTGMRHLKPSLRPLSQKPRYHYEGEWHMIIICRLPEGQNT